MTKKPKSPPKPRKIKTVDRDDDWSGDWDYPPVKPKKLTLRRQLELSNLAVETHLITIGKMRGMLTRWECAFRNKWRKSGLLKRLLADTKPFLRTFFENFDLAIKECWVGNVFKQFNEGSLLLDLIEKGDTKLIGQPDPPDHSHDVTCYEKPV